MESYVIAVLAFIDWLNTAGGTKTASICTAVLVTLLRLDTELTLKQRSVIVIFAGIATLYVNDKLDNLTLAQGFAVGFFVGILAQYAFPIVEDMAISRLKDWLDKFKSK